MPSLDELPWENDVSADDPCQPVKEREGGGGAVLVKAKGKCPKEHPRCVLERRKIVGEHRWETPATDPEVGDPDYEYRCICT